MRTVFICLLLGSLFRYSVSHTVSPKHRHKHRHRNCSVVSSSVCLLGLE
uniref:Uncharacterized protein n=1 Tax=Dactylellina haptotyla TaxID=430498 RepID=B2BK85_9PEZI|nr:hypothetical protein [Dactylellina haptotyla]